MDEWINGCMVDAYSGFPKYYLHLFPDAISLFPNQGLAVPNFWLYIMLEMKTRIEKDPNIQYLRIFDKKEPNNRSSAKTRL